MLLQSSMRTGPAAADLPDTTVMPRRAPSRPGDPGPYPRAWPGTPQSNPFGLTQFEASLCARDLDSPQMLISTRAVKARVPPRTHNSSPGVPIGRAAFSVVVRWPEQGPRVLFAQLRGSQPASDALRNLFMSRWTGSNSEPIRRLMRGTINRSRELIDHKHLQPVPFRCLRGCGRGPASATTYPQQRT